MTCKKINKYIARLYGLAESTYLRHAYQNGKQFVVAKIYNDKEYEYDEWIISPEDYQMIKEIEKDLKKLDSIEKVVIAMKN